MGRLIDAEKLIEQLREADRGCPNDIIKGCIGLVQTQPTAYDVEAVVAEIGKSATDDDGLFVSDGNEPMIWKSKAIEIVRGKE